MEPTEGGEVLACWDGGRDAARLEHHADARLELHRVLDRVEAGEEIIIGRAGRPVALLIPYTRSRTPRRPGAWHGKVRIGDDFDELPPHILDAFGGTNE